MPVFTAAATTGLWRGSCCYSGTFRGYFDRRHHAAALAPIVAIGNFILVLLFVLIKKNQILGIGAGAVLKFAFLFAGVNLFVNWMGIPAQKATAMIAAFSWPQLVTAAIGGVIALLVIKALDRAVEK